MGGPHAHEYVRPGPLTIVIWTRWPASKLTTMGSSLPPQAPTTYSGREYFNILLQLPSFL